MSRFEWKFVSATALNKHVGRIDLDAITMGELKVLCREGMESWRWNNVQSGRHAVDLAWPPLIAPVVRAMDKVGCPLARCAIPHFHILRFLERWNAHKRET